MQDDFRVPLNLETIPTPKEFKDAIESLSPEQQEFCKAWSLPSPAVSGLLIGVPGKGVGRSPCTRTGETA